MSGNQESQRLLLESQFFLVVPFGNIRQLHAAVAVAPGHFLGSEQRNLGAGFFLLNFLTIIGGSFRPLHQRSPGRSGRIKGAALDQRFDNPFVNPPQIYPLAKVVQTLENTIFSGFQNGLDGPGTNVFHGTQTKTHRCADNRKGKSG